jgi:hypothetical protein
MFRIFCRYTLQVMLFLFSLSILISTSSFADGGVRIHRANQFKNLSNSKSDHKKERATVGQREQIRILKLLHAQRLRHHNSSQSQQPKTADSRFPNTYRDLSYQQKLEAQKFRKP